MSEACTAAYAECLLQMLVTHALGQSSSAEAYNNCTRATFRSLSRWKVTFISKGTTNVIERY